jgi:hypothetical protein
MTNTVFRKIIGILIIAAALIITFTLIKRLPPVMKVVSLAANVATIYFTVNYFIKQKKKKEEKNG